MRVGSPPYNPLQRCPLPSFTGAARKVGAQKRLVFAAFVNIFCAMYSVAGESHANAHEKATLYSSSSRSPTSGPRSRARPPDPPEGNDQASKRPSPQTPGRLTLLQKFNARRNLLLCLAAGAIAALFLVAVKISSTSSPHRITQHDIDAAVLHTLKTKSLPSRAAKAYEAIRPSVVRVRGLELEADGDDETEKSVGTGVVVVDKGIILTNLHVVAGARLVRVVFADGLQSDAAVISVHPEQDLAVLQAKTIPDDLSAATLQSTRDLALGDEVIAVGFPFGIGPSVSAGVVSGLGREYISPEGKRPADQPHSIRRGRQSRQLRRPPGNRRRRDGGNRHGDSEPDRAARVHRHRFAVTMESAAAAVGLPPF